MDESLRDLERAVRANPDDARLRDRLYRERARSGLLPTAGDYVRLDGGPTRSDISGNWRIHLIRPSRRPAYPLDDAYVLSAVAPTRAVVAHALLTLHIDELLGAQVAFDAPVTLAEPSIRIPCARCLAKAGYPCRAPSRERQKPHLGRIHVPPLEPPPPPLPVLVGPARQRPSMVKVVESRSANPDVRIKADDLIEKNGEVDLTSGSVPAILDPSQADRRDDE